MENREAKKADGMCRFQIDWVTVVLGLWGKVLVVEWLLELLL